MLRSIVVSLSVLAVINIVLIAYVIYMEAATTYKPQSNQPNTLTKIVGGNIVTQGTYPFVAALVKKFTGEVKEFQCGSAIISKYWVVTAGHCINLLGDSVFVVTSGSIDWKVGGKDHKPRYIKTHEKFSMDSMQNDIALIGVVEPFENEMIVPIANADYSYSEGTVVTVAGWGATSPIVLQAQLQLREVKVKIFSKMDCQNLYTAYHDGMFCAGWHEGNKDACTFDSGGPIFDKNLLIGVVSWGYNCSLPNQPGVYTQINKYYDWITSNTG